MKKCLTHEDVKCKYLVVSARMLMYKLYKECVSIQLNMFGCSRIKPSKYIYLNNYTIFLDTVFRLIACFKKEYERLHNKFGFEKMVLIYDITGSPMKWSMWNNLINKYLSDDYLFKCAIGKLKVVARFTEDDELTDYDSWEEFLANEYKADYHFSMHHMDYKISNYYRKQKAIKEFIYIISLTQMQLSSHEIALAWDYVLGVIGKMKNVSIYKTSMQDFNYNILHVFDEQRTVVISKEKPPIDNIFYYDFNRLYYPAGLPTVKKFEPDETTQLIKWKSKMKPLIDYFKDCEDDCHGKILDINDYMTTEVFRDLNKSYIKNKLDTVTADRFDEDEYSWITVDLYRELVSETVQRFNKLFDVKCV